MPALLAHARPRPPRRSGKRGGRGGRAVQQQMLADEAADVLYVEGDMPLILAVPCGGVKACSTHGSAASAKEWAAHGNGRLERCVELTEDNRCDQRARASERHVTISAGTAITNESGTVRAVATRNLGPTDTHLYYRLLPGGSGDWSGDNWVYTATEQALMSSHHHPQLFFKIKRSTRFATTADNPPVSTLVEGGLCLGRDNCANAMDAGWTLALAEQIRARCWATLGATPHVVICNLAPSVVEVSLSLDDAVSTMVGSGALRQRAEEAWENYHTLIEIARWKAVGGGCGGGSSQQEAGWVQRGGTGLFVELHPLLGGVAWRLDASTHPEYTSSLSAAITPAVSRTPLSTGGEAVQIGYGLPKYELISALKEPNGTSTPPDARTVARAFALFDRDGGGTIDADELRGVCREIGMPMSDADCAKCLEELDEDGSGDIDLREFKQWFQQLAAPGSSGANGGKASKLDELKIRAVLGRSSAAALTRRLQTGDPADAIVGEIALGTILGMLGQPATPALENSTALPVHYEGGDFSVRAHGSGDGGSDVDAVQLAISPALWCSDDADAQQLGGHLKEKGGRGAAKRNATVGRLAICISDALATFLAVNYDYQRVPGSGAARRRNSGGMGKAIWRRFVNVATVARVNPDGTLQLP